ncbi:MAG: hypothetical protein JW720_06850 [Sedimentisphaerales bacterium]|nr:hypothetical protein [Sedimentisphaerales bacterium]
MKRDKQKGFIFILVMMAITALAVVMFVLTSDSNTMIFQSDTAYLRATHRNLTSSALAWASYRINIAKTEGLNKPTELDISNLNTRGVSLSIRVIVEPGKKPQAVIDASCTRKRRTLTKRITCNIE